MSSVVLCLVIYSPLALVGVVRWRRACSQTTWHDTGRAFAERNASVIEARFVSELDQRFQRQDKMQAATIVGTAVVLFAVSVMDGSGTLGRSFLVIIGVAGLLRGLHFCWQAADATPLDQASPRLARLSRVRVGDLVSPWLRVASWVLVAMVAGAAVVACLGEPAGGRVWAMVAGAGLVVTCQGVVVVTSHWVVSRPEPADDPAHLYWQDAFRAESLSHAWSASLMTAGFTWLVAVSVVFGSPLWVSLAPTAIVGAAVGAGQFLDRLRFRTRLWPELGAGDVVPPRPRLVTS